MNHEFVEYVPDVLERNTLYVSMQFATATHLCVCGCGNKVVTPIHPTGWKLEFDGDAVSLRPSIGNWSFRCRSHYWIRDGRAMWAPSMSQNEIERGRQRDRELVNDYFGDMETVGVSAPTEPARPKSFLARLLWWR